MKFKRITPSLTILAAMAVVSAAHADIITVDSDPDNLAMFHDFEDAYNAAENGDTLLLRGSFGSYEIYKQLTIISDGPGNGDATISLDLREDGAIGSASGTRLIGLELEDLGVSGGLSGVEVIKCYGADDGWRTFSPVQIRQCNIDRLQLDAEGIVVVNCWINSLNLNVPNITIDQCLVFSLFNGEPNTSISNTIFLDTNLAINGSSISHSIGIGDADLPAGSGNIDGVVRSDVLGGSDLDPLPGDSVAKNAGTSGQDIGLFAGQYPYTLEMDLPRITRFSVSATATDSTGLEFELDAEAFPK